MAYFDNYKNFLIALKGDKGDPGDIGKSIQAVSTSSEMDAILADQANVGRYYMYLGDTGKYTKGTIYRMGEGEV